MKRFFVILLTLTAFFCAVRAQLPSFQLKNLEGQVVNTAQLVEDGRPVVISFWATWCTNCIRELEVIHEVYPQWLEETNVRFIIVNEDMGQKSMSAKPFVDGRGWEFECLLDPNNEFRKSLNIATIPHTLLLNSEGRIIYSHSGYSEGEEQELYELLLGL